MTSVDYLVIGSGVAGLTFALKIAKKFKERTVWIVTKSDEDESNTKYAQGGVAAVLDFGQDSFEKHLHDTLIAGDGLCEPSVVEMVIKEGPERLQDLMSWGADFDIGYDGKLDLGREGGHSEHRIIHHKDSTGLEIEQTLLKHIHTLPNIVILNHHFVIDLITEHQICDTESSLLTCYGAYVLDQNTGDVETFMANITLLATGGIGMVYGHTTNPTIATGDGIAMAYRAKARIRDMEFIQFHPTLLYDGKKGQSFLISEAVRGFGAYLRSKEGHRFMLDYDERGELASRDIVSRGIDSELQKSGEPCVFIDCTHLDADAFQTNFPAIYSECLKKHIYIEKDWIPVVPAAHYLCGGIDVDKFGRSSIKNLFACGECSRTGLHGANRLASNSLLEALVYANNTYQYLSSNIDPHVSVAIPDWKNQGTVIPNEKIIIRQYLKQLQVLMRNYAGIVRSTKNLQKAIKYLDGLYQEVEKLYQDSKVNPTLCELRNMINVAHLIIGQSLKRSDNKGGYYNTDNRPQFDILKKYISHKVMFYDKQHN